LPLHMAAMRGASIDVVRCMVEALPQCLQIADREGNLSLHCAAMYSCAAVVKLMADISPDACQHANARARLPLHLLFARIWDQDSLALSLIMNVILHNPGALRLPEWQGRLPLHLACEQGHPRQDIVKLLVNSFSAGLLYKEENAGRTPLVICEWMKSTGFRENEVVLAFLRKKTKQEKPKKNGFLGKLFNRRN
jgi:ankyrin repeat protein